METLLSRSSAEEMTIFAAIAHGIWTRRNHVVHGGKFAHPNFIVIEAEDVVAQFWRVKVTMECRMIQPSPMRTKWSNPPLGRLKANWDVALNSVVKRIGTGVIIQDDKGVVFAALSRSVEACPAPVIVEAMGALHAIEFCQDSGLLNIMLEGDSLQVVQAVNAKGEQWLRFGQIIDDIQVVLSLFQRWEVSHVK